MASKLQLIVGRRQRGNLSGQPETIRDQELVEPCPLPVKNPNLTMGRIPSLDGLRALSILLVLAHHSLMGGAFHLRYPFLGMVVGNGQLGVSIFFVISGFLITLLLLKENGAGKISLKRFYIRRAFRI